MLFHFKNYQYINDDKIKENGNKNLFITLETIK
jgi:hypothetical protein